MNIASIALLSGRIMVRPDEPLSRTKGGIFIPDQAKEKPRCGVAVNVAKSPHRFENGAEMPIEVKPGDRVLYGRYGGIPWVDPDTEEEFLILTQQEIFAVLPN